MEKWQIIIYFLFIGILLFIGKVLKTKVPFLNRIVLPTALLGGVVGLLFSDVVIPGSYSIDVDTMTAIVYHALAIGFIALTLKSTKNENKRKVWSTGMVITSTYALQGFIGILLVLLFFSDKFVGAGLLLPLGFGQGPGLATSFGSMWNDMLGGQGIALGASFSFLGFLFGGTVGVVAINILSRRKGLKKPEHYDDAPVLRETIEVETIKEVSFLDGLTVQIVVISIIYGLVYLTLYLFDLLLAGSGSIGSTIFGLLQGFNFIIGIAYALIYKWILRKLKRRGRNVNFMINDYMIANISSLAFNFMITGAILTITVDFLKDYGVLLFVTSFVGGVATLFYVRFITKMVYEQHKDEYFVGLFGMLAGVASTGIALLKGLDRNLETPVAEDMVLGSGTAITIALPLFGFLMLPSLGYQQSYESLFEWISMLGCLGYVVVMVTILTIRSKRKKT